MGFLVKKILLFSGRSNEPFAREVAAHLKMPLGKIVVKDFADGETYVNIVETVRGRDVFLIQPTGFPANHNLMELLIMVDACKRSMAGRITAVIPYFGYAKQDRKADVHEPITARLVANLLERAGADGCLVMDLHADQIQGFFDIRLDFLYASSVIVDYFAKKKLKNLVIVAPDIGASKRARSYAKRLHAGLAIIDKRRPKPNVAELLHLIGDVKGKNCLIVDDEINTGGTVVNAAKALKENGALGVFAACAHPVFAGDCMQNLEKSEIKEVVVTNTILLQKEKQIKKVTVLSVARLFADAILAIHEERSVSALLNSAK
ncbi:MAG: ribose-phosphate pyrophosphokinase [Candidatus Diapherotrites archaeon]|nr:ribose-phosphate pyrophosphokinase [Candidatus Diapherotrites archaeon]